MKKLLYLPGLLLLLVGCSGSGVSDRGGAAKTTATPVSASAKGQVLVVLSSAREIALRDGKTYPTGYYLNELMTPVEAIIKAGYEPVFANPQGNAVPADEHSLSADYFGKDTSRYRRMLQLRASLPQLQRPRRLAEVVQDGLSTYRGVFFPGGHAPMADLLSDPAVGQVLRYFHAQHRPTALICHAPIALLAANPKAPAFRAALVANKPTQRLAEGWPYRGYRMTIFSTNEEQVAEGGQLGGRMLFYPEAALRAAGGQVQIAQEWSANVVQDRELITGQNPFSDDRLSQLFVEALRAEPASAGL
ncbi:type 1 glutamine amidotransferase domain-containing protein [Hymenobacter sp. BT664]|uniref:Type 1 glutamine amidotransferase domain-containing protein n=1 Tax=Hymenobacter montanus TaxID=2771359 RepID=A0A927B9T1_9BACT|nr:type 1 glutamine amidotransferase domain-containing protein [Hymenobacter montanus]MBD2766777.1 type 1 glutamine amidotransferase domain-containing protein [Hymenobacter montanus]